MLAIYMAVYSFFYPAKQTLFAFLAAELFSDNLLEYVRAGRTKIKIKRVTLITLSFTNSEK